MCTANDHVPTPRRTSKFFNNRENRLLDKFAGIAGSMSNFDVFHAVVGYFRSSGYFKLRRHLDDVGEIRILIGINLDDIFRRNARIFELFAGIADAELSNQARQQYADELMHDVQDAAYDADVEKGILQLCDDVRSGRLQLRIHASKSLHAKFYLCLPRQHNANSDGWVIMGSSNLSEQGLGTTEPPRYELNVAMKDYDDVAYCEEEFQTLWNEGIEITYDDVQKAMANTHLAVEPTPYELYLKVLIDLFGNQAEDNFSLSLPDGVMELKYQTDAAIQGYQIMMEHNGCILGDVVGLGKTIVATMIVKRYLERNGRHSHILVVYPPALESNWRDTFRLFGIGNENAQFVSNGSLSHVLEGRNNYWSRESFDLVIVDEAHGFRNDSSDRYNELQQITKAACLHDGVADPTRRKKVLLLSATPVNNSPEDLRNMLLLFQNSACCTIPGVPDLDNFFAPHIERYRDLMMSRRNINTQNDLKKLIENIKELYAEIRTKVLDHITVRRTRQNILNDPDYSSDLQRQGIVFPVIEPPHELKYLLDSNLSKLFAETIMLLTDMPDDESTNAQGLSYARYRAIEHLKPEYRERYPKAAQLSITLAGIYRTNMVKRLESSFEAFRCSLKTLHAVTQQMLNMLDNNRVIIAPDLKIKDRLLRGDTLEQILDEAIRRGIDPNDITYTADCFEPQYREMLERDRDIVQRMIEQWQAVTQDPKFDLFLLQLPKLFFDTKLNPTGKLVIFSEAVDTVNYLVQRLQKIGRTDVLEVHADNRHQNTDAIRANFDANLPESQWRNDYNILITSDVLAEGVNLHRSNVIINYDSPWNATRLMQRIGRVNRIGSKAPAIHNYMFYPSPEGDEQINLYTNALIKLQSFHSAFGEDSQIYSNEEIVEQFQMYDPNVRDIMDLRLSLLRELKEFYLHNREWYNRIKHLPCKCRVARSVGDHHGASLVYLANDWHYQFYKTDDNSATPIAVEDAIEMLKAERDEHGSPIATDSPHFEHVKKSMRLFKQQADALPAANNNQPARANRQERTACAFLRRTKQKNTDNNQIVTLCDRLIKTIDQGIYQRLANKIVKFSNNNNPPDLLDFLETTANEYPMQNTDNGQQPLSSTKIIISEFFN